MSSPFRNTIHDLRAARSMTQQELADLIGMTGHTLNAIEGEYLSPSIAFRITQVFGVPLELVFQYEAGNRQKPRSLSGLNRRG